MASGLALIEYTRRIALPARDKCRMVKNSVSTSLVLEWWRRAYEYIVRTVCRASGSAPVLRTSHARLVEGFRPRGRPSYFK